MTGKLSKNNSRRDAEALRGHSACMSFSYENQQHVVAVWFHHGDCKPLILFISGLFSASFGLIMCRKLADNFMSRIFRLQKSNENKGPFRRTFNERSTGAQRRNETSRGQVEACNHSAFCSGEISGKTNKTQEKRSEDAGRVTKRNVLRHVMSRDIGGPPYDRAIFR